MIGDHRNRRVACLHHLSHTFHAHDLGRVEALHGAAEHRATADRSAQQAGQLHIDAVDLCTVDLGRGVEALHRFSGNLPSLGILQRHVLRRLDPGRCFGHLAEGRGPARGFVRDHTIARAAFGGGNLPLVRRCLDQHQARDRATPSHVFIGFADAAAAGSGEIAPYTIACQVLARRGVFRGDLRPVAIEFLGDELGETGHRTLAHFSARDADHDRVIRADHDPRVDFGQAIGSAHSIGSAEREPQAERKPTACGSGGDEKGAASHLRDVVHAGSLHALAAAE